MTDTIYASTPLIHGPESDGERRLLTVVEAKLLHLAPSTVFHLVSQKRVLVIGTSSRCIRFSRKALLLWFDGLTLHAEELPAARQSKTKGPQ
jgi:hypothetical protein